jgi:D-alanine-D-alanine ligase
MKIALLFSSKVGMAVAISVRPEEKGLEDDEPPPPDFFAECDSDETIQAVAAALRTRHEVVLIESDAEAYLKLRSERPDLVFNMSERLFGPNRESHLPAVCEILDLPYTGSDPLTLSLCLDKSRAKEVLSYHRIATPPFWTVDPGDPLPEDVSLPAIVKPLYEGSSKGVKDTSVVDTRAELAARVEDVFAVYREPAIIEAFLPGREFTVGVLGNHPRYEILPIVEIDHTLLPKGARPIYSYEAKWIWDRPENPLPIFICPARITTDLKGKVEALVAAACRILRVRDWGRVDVRLDAAGEPNILEVNPLPGILPRPEDNSCLPKAARTAGYSYEALILRVADEAWARTNGHRRGGRA